MTTLKSGERTGLLPDRIWRRYGAAPGLITVAPALQLISRISRFGAGRLSLLESIRRHFVSPGLWPGSGMGELLYLAPPALPGSGAGGMQGAPGEGRAAAVQMRGAAALQAAQVRQSAFPGLQSPLRAQAVFDFPLTTRAVRAMTAGRNAVALMGDIMERHGSGALARAIQYTPENVHVTPAAAVPAALSAEIGPASAVAQPSDQVADAEAFDVGGQFPGGAGPRPEVATRTPRAIEQLLETERQVVRRVMGPSSPAAATASSQPTTPFAPAMPVVRVSLRGEAARLPGVEGQPPHEVSWPSSVRRPSAGPPPDAGEGWVERKIVESVTPGKPSTSAEAASEIEPRTSVAGQSLGIGGQSRQSRASAGNVGAGIVRRSLNMSTTQRASSANLPLARAAAVTVAAGRAIVNRAMAASGTATSGSPASGSPAYGPAVDVERILRAGTETVSSSTVERSSAGVAGERTSSETSAGSVVQVAASNPHGAGTTEVTSGGPALLHARLAARAGAEEKRDAGASTALPTGGPASSGPASAGIAVDTLAPPSAAGNELLLSRIIDQAAMSRPEMPDVQRVPAIQNEPTAPAMPVSAERQPADTGRDMNRTAADVMQAQVASTGVDRRAGTLPVISRLVTRDAEPVREMDRGISRGTMRRAAGVVAAPGTGTEARRTIQVPGPVPLARTIMRLPVVRMDASPAVQLDEFSGAAAPVVRAVSGVQAFPEILDSGGASTSSGVGTGAPPLPVSGGAATSGEMRGGMPSAPLPHVRLTTAYAGGGAFAQASQSGAQNSGSPFSEGLSGVRTSANGPGSVLLQRAGDPSISAATPSSSIPPPPASIVGREKGGMGVDLPRLADAVYELIRHRLIRERESKG